MMRDRHAFFFIALLAIAIFARPLVRNEVFTFRDHSDYFQPLRFFTAAEMRHFQLPLWNPYSASGEPWLANPQTAVFYPPFWIFLFIPFARAYVLFLLLHVALLGCGAYLLFSRLASRRAAFIGAVALMLSGPAMSMLDIQNNLTTFAWLPLVLWCALAEETPSLSGVAIAMSFLAGEPFLAAAGALMYVLFVLSRGRGEGPAAHTRRGCFASLRICADVAVTAITLSAVVLFPFLSMIAGSDRAGATAPEEILRDSMPLADWMHIVWTGGVMHQQFLPVIYLGIVPCLLAIAGLSTRAARPWIALLVIAIVVGAGSFLPPVGALLVHLPLTIFRYPARLVSLAALAIAALAALGFDRIAPRAGRWLSVPLVALVIVVDLVPHIAPLLGSAPFDTHAVPYALGIGRDGKIVRFMPPEQRAFDRRVWISGYLNLLERRFDAWTAAPIVAKSYIEAYEDALRSRPALDAMSIAYVLESNPRGVVVQHNTAAFPLAFFRDDRGGVIGPALLAMTTRAVFVVFEAPNDGTVIVTQRDAPGWSVEVDHREATPLRHAIFRAVRITRGHHEIVWRYHPRAFVIGSALSILAIARMLFSKKIVKRRWHKKIFHRDEEFA